jgi:periplasmic divalent cation tolerance protein
MKDEPVLLYTTFPSVVEAEQAGRKLVEAGLAACVNVIPGMRSIYRWEGKIEQAEEVVMIVKSRASNAEKITGAIKAAHTHDNPAILVLPILGGSQPFIDWILAETEKK